MEVSKKISQIQTLSNIFCNPEGISVPKMISKKYSTGGHFDPHYLLLNQDFTTDIGGQNFPLIEYIFELIFGICTSLE